MQDGQINHFVRRNKHPHPDERIYMAGESCPDKLTKLRNIIKMNWEQTSQKRQWLRNTLDFFPQPHQSDSSLLEKEK